MSVWQDLQGAVKAVLPSGLTMLKECEPIWWVATVAGSLGSVGVGYMWQATQGPGIWPVLSSGLLKRNLASVGSLAAAGFGIGCWPTIMACGEEGSFWP